MVDQQDGPLAITIGRSDAGPVVVLTGELDLETAGSLVVACAAEPVSAGQTVTFDCAGLTFLDSSGIRALVELHNRATADGVGFRIVRLPAAQHRVLEITQLLDVLHVEAHDSEG